MSVIAAAAAVFNSLRSVPPFNGHPPDQSLKGRTLFAFCQYKMDPSAYPEFVGRLGITTQKCSF
jgi:hypothetical protein